MNGSGAGREGNGSEQGRGHQQSSRDLLRISWERGGTTAGAEVDATNEENNPHTSEDDSSTAKAQFFGWI